MPTFIQRIYIALVLTLYGVVVLAVTHVFIIWATQ